QTCALPICARCTEFELPRGRSGGCLAARKVRCFQDCAAHAFDAGAPVGPGTGDQLIDAVAELEADAALLLQLLDLLAEDADDLRPRPPGQMEAWHAVAVTGGVAGAALGPTDGGQNVEPQVLEVAALLVGGKADVFPAPGLRPAVVRGVLELGGILPVAPGQVFAVLDPHEPLLRAVDVEQSTEGPERLSAQVITAFLVQDEDVQPTRCGLIGGDEPRQACTDDDDVRIPLRTQTVLPYLRASASAPRAHGARI